MVVVVDVVDVVDVVAAVLVVDVVVLVDVVVVSPKEDPAGPPMAGAGVGATGGGGVASRGEVTGTLEPAGDPPLLGEPAAAVTGRGEVVPLGTVIDVVVVGRNPRDGVELPAVATSPIVTPSAATTNATTKAGVRPSKMDASVRPRTMTQAYAARVGPQRDLPRRPAP